MKWGNRRELLIVLAGTEDCYPTLTPQRDSSGAREGLATPAMNCDGPDKRYDKRYNRRIARCRPSYRLRADAVPRLSQQSPRAKLNEAILLIASKMHI